MNQLHRKDILQLAEQRAQPALSFYLPVTSNPDQQDQNRIRLKNLVAEAETRLAETYGWRRVPVEAFLEPTRRMLADGRFQVAQNNSGLAIFLTNEGQTIYRLSQPVTEKVVISDRFYLKPLLPMLARNGRFFLLSLSLGEVHLYRGTPQALGEEPLGDEMPRSLEDAMKFDDPEQRLQWHTATDSDSAADRPAAFHGQGVSGDEFKKENIPRYCQQIDAALQPLLAGEEAPLLLAAVDYLIPIYREANSYQHLFADSISTDPKSLSLPALHKRALDILSPHFAQEKEEAMAAYNNLADTERVTTSLAEIVPAAHIGQVDRLFVAVDAAVHGVYDKSQNRVIVHDDSDIDNYDLLELAALQTLRNSGEVFALPRQEVPQQKTIAALLRYPELITA